MADPNSYYPCKLCSKVPNYIEKTTDENDSDSVEVKAEMIEKADGEKSKKLGIDQPKVVIGKKKNESDSSEENKKIKPGLLSGVVPILGKKNLDKNSSSSDEKTGKFRKNKKEFVVDLKSPEIEKNDKGNLKLTGAEDVFRPAVVLGKKRNSSSDSKKNDKKVGKRSDKGIRLNIEKPVTKIEKSQSSSSDSDNKNIGLSIEPGNLAFKPKTEKGKIEKPSIKLGTKKESSSSDSKDLEFEFSKPKSKLDLKLNSENPGIVVGKKKESSSDSKEIKIDLIGQIPDANLKINPEKPAVVVGKKKKSSSDSKKQKKDLSVKPFDIDPKGTIEKPSVKLGIKRETSSSDSKKQKNKEPKLDLSEKSPIKIGKKKESSSSDDKQKNFALEKELPKIDIKGSLPKPALAIGKKKEKSSSESEKNKGVKVAAVLDPNIDVKEKIGKPKVTLGKKKESSSSESKKKPKIDVSIPSGSFDINLNKNIEKPSVKLGKKKESSSSDSKKQKNLLIKDLPKPEIKGKIEKPSIQLGKKKESSSSDSKDLEFEFSKPPSKLDLKLNTENPEIVVGKKKESSSDSKEIKIDLSGQLPDANLKINPEKPAVVVGKKKESSSSDSKRQKTGVITGLPKAEIKANIEKPSIKLGKKKDSSSSDSKKQNIDVNIQIPKIDKKSLVVGKKKNSSSDSKKEKIEAAEEFPKKDLKINVDKPAVVVGKKRESSPDAKKKKTGLVKQLPKLKLNENYEKPAIKLGKKKESESSDSKKAIIAKPKQSGKVNIDPSLDVKVAIEKPKVNLGKKKESSSSNDEKQRPDKTKQSIIDVKPVVGVKTNIDKPDVKIGKKKESSSSDDKQKNFALEKELPKVEIKGGLPKPALAIGKKKEKSSSDSGKKKINIPKESAKIDINPSIDIKGNVDKPSVKIGKKKESSSSDTKQKNFALEKELPKVEIKGGLPKPALAIGKKKEKSSSDSGKKKINIPKESAKIDINPSIDIKGKIDKPSFQIGKKKESDSSEDKNQKISLSKDHPNTEKPSVRIGFKKELSSDGEKKRAFPSKLEIKGEIPNPQISSKTDTDSNIKTEKNLINPDIKLAPKSDLEGKINKPSIRFGKRRKFSSSDSEDDKKPVSGQISKPELNPKLENPSVSLINPKTSEIDSKTKDLEGKVSLPKAKIGLKKLSSSEDKNQSGKVSLDLSINPKMPKPDIKIGKKDSSDSSKKRTIGLPSIHSSDHRPSLDVGLNLGKHDGPDLNTNDEIVFKAPDIHKVEAGITDSQDFEFEGDIEIPEVSFDPNNTGSEGLKLNKPDNKVGGIIVKPEISAEGHLPNEKKLEEPELPNKNDKGVIFNADIPSIHSHIGEKDLNKHPSDNKSIKIEPKIGKKSSSSSSSSQKKPKIGLNITPDIHGKIDHKSHPEINLPKHDQPIIEAFPSLAKENPLIDPSTTANIPHKIITPDIAIPKISVDLNPSHEEISLPIIKNQKHDKSSSSSSSQKKSKKGIFQKPDLKLEENKPVRIDPHFSLPKPPDHDEKKPAAEIKLITPEVNINVPNLKKPTNKITPPEVIGKVKKSSSSSSSLENKPKKIGIIAPQISGKGLTIKKPENEDTSSDSDKIKVNIPKPVIKTKDIKGFEGVKSDKSPKNVEVNVPHSLSEKNINVEGFDLGKPHKPELHKEIEENPEFSGNFDIQIDPSLHNPELHKEPIIELSKEFKPEIHPEGFKPIVSNNKKDSSSSSDRKKPKIELAGNKKIEVDKLDISKPSLKIGKKHSSSSDSSTKKLSLPKVSTKEQNPKFGLDIKKPDIEEKITPTKPEIHAKITPNEPEIHAKITPTKPEIHPDINTEIPKHAINPDFSKEITNPIHENPPLIKSEGLIPDVSTNIQGSIKKPHFSIGKHKSSSSDSEKKIKKPNKTLELNPHIPSTKDIKSEPQDKQKDHPSIDKPLEIGILPIKPQIHPEVNLIGKKSKDSSSDTDKKPKLGLDIKPKTIEINPLKFEGEHDKQHKFENTIKPDKNINSEIPENSDKISKPEFKNPSLNINKSVPSVESEIKPNVFTKDLEFKKPEFNKDKSSSSSKKKNKNLTIKDEVFNIKKPEIKLESGHDESFPEQNIQLDPFSIDIEPGIQKPFHTPTKSIEKEPILGKNIPKIEKKSSDSDKKIHEPKGILDKKIPTISANIEKPGKIGKKKEKSDSSSSNKKIKIGSHIDLTKNKPKVPNFKEENSESIDSDDVKINIPKVSKNTEIHTGSVPIFENKPKLSIPEIDKVPEIHQKIIPNLDLSKDKKTDPSLENKHHEGIKGEPSDKKEIHKPDFHIDKSIEIGKDSAKDSLPKVGLHANVLPEDLKKPKKDDFKPEGHTQGIKPVDVFGIPKLSSKPEEISSKKPDIHKLEKEVLDPQEDFEISFNPDIKVMPDLSKPEGPELKHKIPEDKVLNFKPAELSAPDIILDSKKIPSEPKEISLKKPEFHKLEKGVDSDKEIELSFNPDLPHPSKQENLDKTSPEVHLHGIIPPHKDPQGSHPKLEGISVKPEGISVKPEGISVNPEVYPHKINPEIHPPHINPEIHSHNKPFELHKTLNPEIDAKPEEISFKKPIHDQQEKSVTDPSQELEFSFTPDIEIPSFSPPKVELPSVPPAKIPKNLEVEPEEHKITLPKIKTEKKKKSSSSSSKKKKIGIITPNIKPELNLENLKLNKRLDTESSKSSEVEINLDSQGSSPKKRQIQSHRRKKQEEIVESVSSSDLSDEETEELITLKPSKLKDFVDLVSDVFNAPRISSEEFKARGRTVGIKKKASIKQVNLFMQGFLTEKEYNVANIISLCFQMHTSFKKFKLKEKECWLVVLAARIRLDEAIVDHDRAAYAVSKALKYIMLRKT